MMLGQQFCNLVGTSGGREFRCRFRDVLDELVNFQFMTDLLVADISASLRLV